MKKIGVACLFALFGSLLFAVLMYGTSYKTVALVVNGKETVVHTHQAELGPLLREQGVRIGEHDYASVPLDARLKQGDRIEIDHAIPIQLTVGGQTDKVYTVGRTVEAALDDLHLALGPYDKIYPDLQHALTANQRMTIIRVNKVREDHEQPIPFEVVQKKDGSLTKGKSQVVQQGKPGIRVQTLEKTFSDGKLTAVAVLDSKVKEDAVNQIVAVGTKKPVVILSVSSPVVDQVTKQGLTFGVKEILSNVILTAYDAGYKSTGKRPGDRQYGITYTGTTVEQGRTIAVDPKVIPLGWWVYIEGIGFRRAEDTGSGVKGKWIDIYYDSSAYVDSFGLKRGNTVYVIGPALPAAK